MTVAELRAALEALPPQAAGWTVVLSRDAEGNGFSPLRDMGRGFYGADTTWQGDFLDAGDPEEPEDGAGWADGLDAPGALCLWPVR